MFSSFASFKEFDERPGYRIDSCIIKRGYLKRCSIVVSSAQTMCLVWDRFMLKVHFRSPGYLKGVLDFTLCVVSLSGEKWLYPGLSGAWHIPYGY